MGHGSTCFDVQSPTGVGDVDLRRRRGRGGGRGLGGAVQVEPFESKLLKPGHPHFRFKG
jgi:hypothetical protein